MGVFKYEKYAMVTYGVVETLAELTPKVRLSRHLLYLQPEDFGTAPLKQYSAHAKTWTHDKHQFILLASPCVRTHKPRYCHQLKGPPRMSVVTQAKEVSSFLTRYKEFLQFSGAGKFVLPVSFSKSTCHNSCSLENKFREQELNE